MISQFFILNARGDTLITKDYRGDLTKQVPERLYREIQTADQEKEPIFSADGITFAWTTRGSLTLALTTRFNMSPSLLMEVLIQIVKTVQDLCGVLNEKALRRNFILVYEILDEMLDFGYPQLMKTSDVRPRIFALGNSLHLQLQKFEKI